MAARKTRKRRRLMHRTSRDAPRHTAATLSAKLASIADQLPTDGDYTPLSKGDRIRGTKMPAKGIQWVEAMISFARTYPQLVPSLMDPDGIKARYARSMRFRNAINQLNEVLFILESAAQADRGWVWKQTLAIYELARRYEKMNGDIPMRIAGMRSYLKARRQKKAGSKAKVPAEPAG